jgi:uncharacterized membrane protein
MKFIKLLLLRLLILIFLVIYVYIHAVWWFINIIDKFLAKIVTNLHYKFKEIEDGY